MRLKNFLLVVEDIHRSKAFYKELFGLDVITDFDTNVILTGGLVLQQRDGWEQLIGQETVHGGHAAELYFETTDMAGFLRKVRKIQEAQQEAQQEVQQEKQQETGIQIHWLTPPLESIAKIAEEEPSEERLEEYSDSISEIPSAGEALCQVVRLYDPDGHVIEVAGY